jgi:hypothetical protein
VQWFANQGDAQNAYNSAINNVFNLSYAQILQVSATVVKATAGSPSGAV